MTGIDELTSSMIALKSGKVFDALAPEFRSQFKAVTI